MSERSRQRKQQLYFWKQRACGVLILLLTILGAIIMDGDITFAVLTVPMGLAMIFSKEMLINDDYYFEMEGQMDEQG